MSSLDGGLRWREDGGLKPVDVETQRIRSELLTAESQRLILESDRVSKRMQRDADKKLAQRDREVQFLRRELEQKLKEVIEETDVLLSYGRRVEMSLEACKEPLTVTRACLEQRLKRVPVDRVQDEVERQLLQESEVIEGVASLLQRTLEQINEQLRLNRSARYHVEKDLKDKFTAQCIDDSCSLMRNHSTGSEHKSKHPDVILPSMVIIIPDEWESFSGINMSKAEREKVNSVSLRALVDSLLEQTATDMQRQLHATDSAFRLEALETRTVKTQMEEHLDKILAELGSQEKNMESLQTAVSEEQKPLQVAQARLCARGRRPGTELCHDPVQSRLLSEVQQLTNHINRMREALLQSETEQKKLIRCQLNLQENIDIKANSLYIDEVICAQLREPINIHRF